MNINMDIVKRAMDKAGEEPIIQKQIEENSTKWRLIKDYYHATILETLCNTEWNSQTTRKQLTLSETDNISSYYCKYDLPIDCAKPVALLSEDDYLVEGKHLYSDDPDAVLIYVSNKYTGEYKYVMSHPQPEEIPAANEKYYVRIEDEEGNASYELAEEYEEGVAYFERVEEDYPLYDDYEFDALLSEYLENQLAAKIVLKLTGKTDLYQLLRQDAMYIEQKAVKSSFAHKHNKAVGNKYWGDILGLPSYE